MIKDKGIFIKNIYYMLSYAFNTLNQTEFEDVEKEEFDNIHNLFAAILGKGLSKLIKHGLYREYVDNVEDLSVLRGKIEMSGTIKRRVSHQQVLTCEFDQLSENNLLNQILKTTVNILLRFSNIEEEYRNNLKKEMLYFSNVDTIDPKSIRWSSIRFQRNNLTYRMLISLCQLLLEGMLLTTESGTYKLANFIDNQEMSRLYEKFILEFYIKEFPDLKVSASQIKWSLDDGIGTMLPIMQSDIMVSKGNNVLIIDAKYYSHITQERFDNQTLRSNNLYQIFTYVKNKDMEFGDKPHTVSGLLLYAQTEDSIQPDTEYKMSGNKISVKTLDLNCEFNTIANKLNSIIENEFNLIN